MLPGSSKTVLKPDTTIGNIDEIIEKAEENELDLDSLQHLAQYRNGLKFLKEIPLIETDILMLVR